MSRVCTADKFQLMLTEMLEDSENTTAEQMRKACRASAAKGRREVKSNIDKSEIKQWTGKYNAGWATSTKANGNQRYSATIYNKTMPGLAHLLEKGHAKVGGGRVKGIKHIEPAAEVAFEDFEKRLEAIRL